MNIYIRFYGAYEDQDATAQYGPYHSVSANGVRIVGTYDQETTELATFSREDQLWVLADSERDITLFHSFEVF